MKFLEKLDQIKKALDLELYYPALLSAIILPEVCMNACDVFKNKDLIEKYESFLYYMVR